MAKFKNTRKSGLSDKINNKKKFNSEKKTNPFEVHVNSNQKFNVINRKATHSIGKPGISRARAVEKRKQTLGQEFDVKYKSNSFKDNRKFGAGHKSRKESIYNLNDDFVLTHKGQKLAEIERFDEPVNDEDELSNDEVRLDADFTKQAHFGGGSDDEKDRKTVIEELIAESKKRKIEQLRENEEMFEKTKELDENWKSLLSVVNQMKKTDDDVVKPPQDEYDRMVKEMIFEPRGVPAEKLKTEEEIARIEKERLEKLERERLFRMRGEEEDDVKTNHRSADDLDDGYFASEVIEDENDRVIGYEIEDNHMEGTDEQEPDEADESDEEAEEEKEKDEDEDEDEENQEGEAESESESEEENDEMENLEDLKASSSESEDEKIPEETKTPPTKPTPTPVQELPDNSIPFTIKMPQSYEQLSEIMQNHTAVSQGVIIERIIKTNHQRLLKENREKMIKLFAYLMQYVNDLFSNADEDDIENCFKLLDKFTPYFYELAQMNPTETAICFIEIVKEKYELYKKTSKMYPKLDTIIFFKLLGSLYPTSDFRHPVVTPAMIFMHHILSQAHVKTARDVTKGLFLVNLILDYQQLSKRFLPASINFLQGICYLGIKKSMMNVLKPMYPFKKNSSSDSILVLDDVIPDNVELSMTAKDLVITEINDSFRSRALHLTVSLINDFIELYVDHIGVKYLIVPFLRLFDQLSDESNLPKTVKDNVAEVLKKFENYSMEKRFVYPIEEKKKQKMLRMLEPKIETVYSDRRQMYSVGGPAKGEEQKLKRQVKREFKDAKRELRRDNEFLSKLQLKRRIQSDRERQEKVKRLFNEASVQQSEFNALQRTKGRKNKF